MILYMRNKTVSEKSQTKSKQQQQNRTQLLFHSRSRLSLTGFSAEGFTWLKSRCWPGLLSHWKLGVLFQAVVGLWSLFSCRLSAGDCSQLLEATHNYLPTGPHSQFAMWMFCFLLGWPEQISLISSAATFTFKGLTW